MAKRTLAVAPGAAVAPVRVLALAATLGVTLVGAPWLAPASADVCYEQRITSASPASPVQTEATNKVYVKRDSERSEMAVASPAGGRAPAGQNQLISITRLDRRLIWYLDPENKSYKEISFAEIRSAFAGPRAAARDSARGSTSPASEVRVERTGKKDTVCGTQAEQVILTISSPLADPALQGASQYIVAELWMATDFPGAAELAAHSRATVDRVGFAQMGPAGGRNPFSHLMQRLAEEMKKLEGTAVRTVLTLEIDAQAGVAGLSPLAAAHGEGRQVIVTLTSEMTKVESKEVPAALFEIPAGYTRDETGAAATPGAGARP